MLYNEPTVDEITADIINARRDLVVERAVDEYLCAEKDILIEATTSADNMVDLYLDDNDPETIELNGMLDSEIDEFIEGEDDEFQDTLGDEGFYDEDDVIEDIEDVIEPDEFFGPEVDELDTLMSEELM